MYYLTNFHLNLKLVDIIRATKIRIIILITYKLSVNIRILSSILFINECISSVVILPPSFPTSINKHPLVSSDPRG